MRDRIAIIDINTKKFKAISYKQYDENNILQIVITENGNIIGLSNYSAIVKFQLPSGVVYEVPSIIENNTIKLILTRAILSEYGKVIVEIVLLDIKQLITTFSIYLNVEKSINNEDSQLPEMDTTSDYLHKHKNKEVLDQITQEMIDSIFSIDEMIDVVDVSYQKKIDNALETNDKTIVGSINEVNKKIEEFGVEDLDLSDYATKKELPTKVSQLENDLNYLTNIPKEYITDEELNAKGYLTNIPEEYITETELNNKGYLTNIPSEYVTEEELNAKGYLTEHQDLSHLATKNELNNKADKSSIPTKVSQLENDSNYLTNIPEEYITETELNNKGYLTEHQDLSNYPTKDELNDAIEGIDVSEQLEDFATKEEVSKNTNDINKILEIIDEPPTYVNPTLTISTSSTNIQHNTQTNVVLTPRFAQNDAGAIISYSLSKDGKVLYTNTTASAYTDVITLRHGGSTTYTATVNYGDGIIKNTLLGIEYPSTSIKEGNISNNVTIRGYALSYYGVIEGDSISDTNGLSNVLRTSKGSTLTFNMTNQRVIYMYPKSFGNLTSIKDANNFDYINSYTLTNMTLDNVEYNVYILTDAVTINGFKQIFN